MSKALEVHELNMTRGDAIPEYAMLMFIRDKSDTIGVLFKNHINGVGDTGVNVIIYRLKQFGKTNFIAHYNN